MSLISTLKSGFHCNSAINSDKRASIGGILNRGIAHLNGLFISWLRFGIYKKDYTHSHESRRR